VKSADGEISATVRAIGQADEFGISSSYNAV